MKRKFLAFMTATMFFMLLLSSTVLAAYQRTADNTVPAYRNSSLTQRTGNERVDKGDVVTVFQETDKAYYVRYPVRNGTKDRWVPKYIFNSTAQSQQASTAHNPEGCLDSVVSNANNQITIRGWALDRDNVNEQIRVHVYIGGPAGSGEGHEIYANTYRPDVNKALAGVGEYHGFEATINTERTGSQSVYVYGINIGGGENKDLSGSPKTVNINSVSKGNVSLSPSGYAYPLGSRSNFGNGHDCAKPEGTPVYAVESGTAYFYQVMGNYANRGYATVSYGNYIQLKCDNGAEARYGHLSRFEGVALRYKSMQN